MHGLTSTGLFHAAYQSGDGLPPPVIRFNAFRLAVLLSPCPFYSKKSNLQAKK